MRPEQPVEATAGAGFGVVRDMPNLSIDVKLQWIFLGEIKHYVVLVCTTRRGGELKSFEFASRSGASG